MNELLGMLSLCFSTCFVIEGLSSVASSKVSFVYIITRVGYPLFIACSLFYFLATGVLD